MPAYLITGEPGAGKSSLAVELRRRGYLAYDADNTPGLAFHADPATGQPITEKRDHYADTDWLWDAALLRALLDSGETVLLAGVSSNQEAFYPLFARIFVLTIDAETLTQRLQHRQPGDYGMHPEELRYVLRTFEDWTRQMIEEEGAIPIDATQPLAQVADAIIARLL